MPKINLTKQKSLLKKGTLLIWLFVLQLISKAYWEKELSLPPLLSILLQNFWEEIFFSHPSILV